MTPPPGTVLTLQYLRGIAVTVVVIHHSMLIPSAHFFPPRLAEFCVDVFFVISGFIMWFTTIDGKRGPGAFWLARVVRVVPLYWIYTTLYILVALAIPSVLNSGTLVPYHLIASYLFIPAEHPTAGGAAPILSLGWTMNYEMFFYFFFGMFLFIRNARVRLPLMIAFFLCFIIAGLVLQPTGAIARTYTDLIMIDFIVGVAFAVWFQKMSAMPRALALTLIAFAVGWLTVVHSLPQLPERFIAHSIPAAVGVAGVLMLERSARKKPSAFLLLLGDASYSIYLAHPFALRAWFIMFTFVIGTETYAKAVVCVVTTAIAGVIGGLISWFVLEKPMLAAIWGLIRGRRRRAAANEAAGARPTR